MDKADENDAMLPKSEKSAAKSEGGDAVTTDEFHRTID